MLTGLSLPALSDYSDYWESVRRYYAPFEEGMLAPTASVHLPSPLLPPI